ncbi:hypothetical protein [Paraburkholderia haematera]|uniref:SH3 domain-containing protein n=1 Tax=Paraburkholderia haematera TaxID=2793077 RepID=A0ABM8QTE3_9BURK|nr:hypothetical protein [Paraburkholderia haematera]CAE6714467.1 hypothetical protein R69888_01306 [Paraburkholderia haematera]
MKKLIGSVAIFAASVSAHAAVVGTFPQSYMTAQITDASCDSNPATRGMMKGGHVAIVRDDGQDHFGCWVHRHTEGPHGTLSVIWFRDEAPYELPWGMVRDPNNPNIASKW